MPMRNRTRIVAVSPGVNDDDIGAAQKQQTTSERRRRAVHWASRNSEPTARGDVGAATHNIIFPTGILSNTYDASMLWGCGGSLFARSCATEEGNRGAVLGRECSCLSLGTERGRERRCLGARMGEPRGRKGNIAGAPWSRGTGSSACWEEDEQGGRWKIFWAPSMGAAAAALCRSSAMGQKQQGQTSWKPQGAQAPWLDLAAKEEERAERGFSCWFPWPASCSMGAERHGEEKLGSLLAAMETREEEGARWPWSSCWAPWKGEQRCCTAGGGRRAWGGREGCWRLKNFEGWECKIAKCNEGAPLFIEKC
jgi:hypothetical protein